MRRRLRVLLGVLVSCGLAGSVAASPDLGPRLLDDREEQAAYLAAFPASDYEIAEVAGIGRFYVDDNPAKVKKTLRAGKPWEPHVLAELEKGVRRGSVALDVGAHIGSISVPLAGIVGPEGHVYAFEPQRKIHRELAKNIELNGLENVTALRFAASDEPAVIEMGAAWAQDGRVRVGAGGDRAEARTIDSFGFENVGVIKIDVEGYEMSVLRGALETIDRDHPLLVIEIWTPLVEKVTALLEARGYRLRPISNWEYVAEYQAGAGVAGETKADPTP